MISKMKETYQKHKEVINYLVFGVATTLVNWVTYSALVKGFSMDEKVSNVIAVIVSVVFAFVTNKLWVFESQQKNRNAVLKEALSFFGSRAVTAVIEIVGVPLLLLTPLNKSLFGVEGLVAKVAISVVIIILNYLFSKFIVFKKVKPVEEEETNK